MSKIMCIPKTFIKLTFLSTILFFNLSSIALASDLSKCISNYCGSSCRATSNCGFIARSQIPACKSSCIPSAKNSLSRVAKSKRLNACKTSKSNFSKLTCGQVGTLLGITSGNGNTKRSLHAHSEGVKLGNQF